MEYYKEYNNQFTEENTINGILNYDIYEEKYYCNDLYVINNRGICDDNVIINLENNEIIGIKNRNNTNIVGILYLDSKIKYGFYKNKLLYLFVASNKKYGSFYVPYDIKKNNHKIFVVIQFKEWKITDKLPLGTVIETLGKVGDKEVEYEHLRYYFNIKQNVMKIENVKRENDVKIIEELQTKVYDYEVFSIDPKGSLDIDDAFHFKIIDSNSNNYEIGIHIASPYLFFKNELNEILNRVSTVYLIERKYNMLPNKYADDLISLLQNKNRYALSLILKIENNIVINYELKQTIVKNIRNYTYENFDINQFIEYSNLFFNDNNNDTHKLVENWMIYTNKFIAKILIYERPYIKNTIIRSNYKNNGYVINELLKNKDMILIDYCYKKQDLSANYEIYNKDKEQTHIKMNNEYYTHFTSPIRRAIDLFIHGLLLENKDLIDDNVILEKYIDKINIFNKNNRKFDRNIKRLELLYNIKNEYDNILTYGYIIKINEYSIKIYIPEYKLEEHVIIIPYKYRDITEYNIEKENDINIKIRYKIGDENEKICNLYEKKDIKIWIFLKSDNIFDKLKIEIL